MMAMEAMPTPAAVKPLAKREADFSARRLQRPTECPLRVIRYIEIAAWPNTKSAFAENRT
jgi:hypothetical protein